MKLKRIVFGAINLEKKTKSLSLKEAVRTSHDLCRKTKDVGTINISYITNLYQKYIETKPDKNQLLDILKLQFFKDSIDTNYFGPYSLLINKFLEEHQHSLNQGEIIRLFYATEHIFNLKQKNTEHLKLTYFQILEQIRLHKIESLFKASFLLMRANREYNMRLLDFVNLQLYTKSIKLNLLYLRTLNKAGRQLFPEILFELRDNILENQLKQYQIIELLDIFELFCQSSLHLMNTASYKVMKYILVKENIKQLNIRQKLAFLYLVTKYNLYTTDLFYLFSNIMKQFDNTSNFSIFILCLSNINCKDQDFLVQLNKKYKLKEIIGKMQTISKQDKDYLEYLKNKF